jgi:hypothetical protein
MGRRSLAFNFFLHHAQCSGCTMLTLLQLVPPMGLWGLWIEEFLSLLFE